MRQAQGELSIIRQKNQSLAVVVQPPDRLHRFPLARQQFINRRPVQLVLARTNAAMDGLITNYPARLTAVLERLEQVRPELKR